jgi:lysophospholipase L1-like esterase
MASNADAILELDADVTPSEAFEIRASHARLFGVSVEARSGVVVDSFGVSGARAEHADRWDDPTFQASVRALAPDVVFLAYGTNESSGTRPVPEHARSLESMIDRVRRAAPSAPCVVIGPSNYPLQRGGERVVRPRSAEVRSAFRAAAIGRGCGYVDLIAFQGGESNLEQWERDGLVLGDRVHMTDAGHERLAAALERALVGP